MVKNRIILGLMTFGPDIEWGARTTSLSEFGLFLDHFQSAGYSELDTARTYQNGIQESVTAAAGYASRNLSLATKLYPIPASRLPAGAPAGHHPAAIRANVEKSLAELKADSVDIWYLHAPDRSVNFEDTLEEVNRLHGEGKFKRWGVSNFAAFEVAEMVMICRERGWVRPSVYQGCYNAITRSIESELIPVCRRYGLDVVIYNGLAGGLLTGKYKAGKTEEPGQATFVGGVYRQMYIRNGYLDAVDIIEPVASKHGLSLIEVAMRWLVHHSALKMRTEGGNDGIIIGASSLDQLDNNLALLEKGPLPQEVVDALDAGWLAAKATVPNYWHMDLKYSYDTQEALFGKDRGKTAEKVSSSQL